MGKDYYAILDIPKTASGDELKKAYRKAAIKWHPDKWSGKSESEQKNAEEKFKDIAEAYDVLSDTEKRAVFDKYGEEGLKTGGLPPSGEDNSGFHNYHGSPTGPGYTFQGDPNELFAQFFSGGMRRQRSFGENPFANGSGFGGLEAMFADMGGMGGYGGNSGMGAKRPRPSERICNVTCTLEELYAGKTKKMKVTRKSLTPGRPTEKTLEVPIKPGYKAGTRITFAEEGDELSVGIAEDLVFVVRELAHDRFVREGSDLHFRHKVSLADALCGFTVDVRMLDASQRIKRVNVRGPISPKQTKVLTGEGMPRSKEPGTKGDLVITFEVSFPSAPLSAEQKTHVRAAL